MAISSVDTGTNWGYDTSGSLTVEPISEAAGDMMIVRVAYKSSAIATCSASTATSGWAKVGEFHNGTTNSGNGTGSVGVAAFWKIATSGSEANLQVDFSQAQTQAGAVFTLYRKGAGESGKRQ